MGIRNLDSYKDHERRIEALERLAANPVMIISDPNAKTGRPAFMERLRKRLKLWKFKRAYMRSDVTPEEAERAFKGWTDSPDIENLKKHPPKPFS